MLVSAAGPQDSDHYLHWDKLRHLTPPHGLTSEEWWMAVKIARSTQMRRIPLLDTGGAPFRYCLPDGALEALHEIDTHTSGAIAMPAVITSDAQASNRYMVNSLMEEAIRSSQLEGAATTRRIAKEMLRTGRQPNDRSERMIANNYLALQLIRDMVEEDLTPELVYAIHRAITDGTLDNPDAAGRLQRSDEDRVSVVDSTDGTILHRPPSAEELPLRIERFCEFANARDAKPFIHPVVRSILLHFWLAYDHPFEDGNGRTARALFYWHMLKQGYWLVEYLPVSRILMKAPAQYGRAFLLTETDENDTTYFLLHQLDAIEQAIDELRFYLGTKAKELEQVSLIVKHSPWFNDRQIALLGHALRNEDASYTFVSHATSHGVTHETARHDLARLVEAELLIKRRAGRKYVFVPVPNIKSRLKRIGRERARNE